MTGFRAVTAYIISIICLVISSGCNISYEDAPDYIRTGIHRSLPPFTNIYHGDPFRFPVNNCDEVQCHGAVLTGGNSGAPSCYSCHGDRWMIFYDTHTLEIGGYYHQKDLNSVSSLISGCGGDNCHGADLEGVSGKGYRCKNCHDPIPVPGHKSLPPFSSVYHKAYYRFPSGNCTPCHGASLTGVTDGAPSCYSCHGNIWAIFSDTHTLAIDGMYHKNDLNTVTGLVAGCGGDDCHGTILEGVAGKGYRCKDCHNPVPAPAHNLNRDGVRHRSGTEASCGTAGCHGDPGRNGRLCSSCHD